MKEVNTDHHILLVKTKKLFYLFYLIMTLSRNLGENVNDVITEMDNHNNCLQQLCSIP